VLMAQTTISDLQSAVAYLSHAALLLRRRVHRERVSVAEANTLVESAADIQRLIEAIEHTEQIQSGISAARERGDYGGR
jgi:hypothetical protein